MKRVSNLYNKITSIDTIIDMYESKIKINTKNKRKIQEFENNYCSNIVSIKESLINKDYKVGKYNIFLIREPKLRIIMSQSIEDKIVSHLVAKYFLVDIFDKSLLDRNCATRINKGTHYALKLFKNDYNYFLNKYNKFYILKIDISKFFYNINHDIVKHLIRKKVKDRDVLKILDTIIDSTDEDYINNRINKLKYLEIKRINNSNLSNKEKIIKLKEINELPIYKKSVGCCIGNMVSQVIATFYLSELDHFIFYDLKCKHFARYMDDIYIMNNDKSYLKECLNRINIVIKQYKLKLNKKTKIYVNNENIEFLGFMFSSKNNNIKMKLVNKTKTKFINNMKIKNNEYKMGLINFNEYRSVRDSYRGHLNYGNCDILYRKVVKYLN